MNDPSMNATADGTALDPIQPHEAVEMYLDTRRDDLAESTYRSQKCRLGRFAEWCEGRDVTNLNDLGGRDLYQYKIWLRDHYNDGEGVSRLTIRTRLSTVRVFLRFCIAIDAVDSTLPEKIVLPQVDREDRTRDEIIEEGHARETLDALQDRRFATREHIAFAFLWKSGCRLGTLRALAVTDVDCEERLIYVRHRPDEGTPLKNKQSAERVIAIEGRLTNAIETYIDRNRIPAQDDYEREPLLTTRHGRPSPDTIRSWVHRAQQSCFHSNECPHGKTIPECSWRHTYDRDKCPDTQGPHNIRRGAISKFLSEDIPKRATEDRADVSGDVLDTHYDKRDETSKAEQRRKFFDDGT